MTQGARTILMLRQAQHEEGVYAPHIVLVLSPSKDEDCRAGPTE